MFRIRSQLHGSAPEKRGYLSLVAVFVLREVSISSAYGMGIASVGMRYREQGLTNGHATPAPKSPIKTLSMNSAFTCFPHSFVIYIRTLEETSSRNL